MIGLLSTPFLSCLFQFAHYNIVASFLCLQLTLSQQLNLITLAIFLQQETRVVEWLYFKGNQRSVSFKTMKDVLVHDVTSYITKFSLSIFF